MPSDSQDLSWARHVLSDWAHWLMRGGGYAHQSTIEWCRQGTGGGVFSSRIPLDVEPSPTTLMASRAMQYLRVMDGASAELLQQLYLKRADTTLAMLAEENGIGLTLYQTRRRLAEQKFLGLFQSLGSD